MSSRPTRVCQSPAASACPPAWRALLAALPLDEAELERSARAYGALQRRRSVRTAGGLLRLLLAYALSGWSLRLTAAWAEVGGVGRLNEAALRRRLDHGHAWLAHLLAQLLLDVRQTATLPPARVRLIDATVVRTSAAPRDQWRVHLSATVAPVGRIDGLELTSERTGESLRRHPVQAGEIVVADRGYCQPRHVRELLAAEGHFVLRYATLRPLRDPEADEDTPLDLTPWLRALTPGRPTERVVVWAPGDPPLRLIAVALPSEAAQQARARCRRKAQRKGRTPRALSLLAAGALLVLTDLPADAWRAAAVLELYRVRWQVELVFKRLKGLWHLDSPRVRTAARVQTVLLGVLLGALLAERLAHPLGPPRVDWFTEDTRPVSLWRWTALWHQVLLQALIGLLPLALVVKALASLRRHLCDPPRRRRQQAAQARCLLATLPLPLPLAA